MALKWRMWAAMLSSEPQRRRDRRSEPNHRHRAPESLRPPDDYGKVSYPTSGRTLCERSLRPMGRFGKFELPLTLDGKIVLPPNSPRVEK